MGMVSSSTLKVLPAIIQMPSPIKSNIENSENEHLMTNIDSDRILPDCNEIVISSRSNSNCSSINKNLPARIFTDNYDAENIRNVYERNFGSSQNGSSVNSENNVYKTMKRQKSGGKPRSLTRV